jgi:hypothetical protein
MKDPAMKAIADDIRTTNLPIGPVGKSVELHQTSTISIFNHCKFPNAAKAYIEFMYRVREHEQMAQGASAYCCQALKEFAATRSGPRTRSMRPMRKPRNRCARTAMPGRWGRHRPAPWPIMSCSRNGLGFLFMLPAAIFCCSF